MNSALQCLSNVPQLTKYFLTSSTNSNSVSRTYSNLLKGLWTTNNKLSTTPALKSLKNAISGLAPIFTDYQQQDSHEFMNVLLNAIQLEHSDIERLFLGKIQSTVICSKCGVPDCTIDDTSFLQLPLPQEKSRLTTISDCVEEFMKEDDLDGQWHCSTCNGLHDARQKSDIYSLPEVLIIQLKRFNHDPNRLDKIDINIDYPLYNLDLTKYVIEKQQQTWMYNLVAVSVHRGQLSGGHYVTYAKNKDTQEWYEFNDEHVTRINDESTVKTKDAYVLIYLRND
ncbi:unnamed protein product [Didymodactylos carnosus]|uniref:ubiquitinyl hydrolase 1 n=1 Tax=Didymodactylos carnosus TaxID=1234261 RepID=A0A8S2NPJ7_9BILA|nr:unnamed protein product [Didymodactylos carnosus]CAF4012085.1 unnamed protein product [Didymodactylos carnosus]